MYQMYQSLGVEVIDLCAPLKFGFLRFDVAWHAPTGIGVFIQLHNVIHTLVFVLWLVFLIGIIYIMYSHGRGWVL